MARRIVFQATLLLLIVWCGLSLAQVSGPEPTAEGEATGEPGPHPENEPEPEPEGEGEPEPEGESEPTAQPDSPFAEPVPAWDVALPLYKWAWPFHIYLLGVLFALLAVYSLGSIIKLRERRLLSHGYFIALNLLMLLMGVIRAVYLLVDAYNFKGIWPNVVAYLFLGTGFPCLTSAFSILFMALLQSTKTRLVPPSIQKPKYLAVVIISHFAFAFIADVVVGLFASAAALLLACQVAFVVWGVFLTVSYLVIFRRLYRSSVRKFREISRLSVRTSSIILPGERPLIKPRNNWGSAIRITLVTAFLGLLIAVLQVYGMLVVYGPVGGQKQIPDPWPWWGYQFTFRVLEFLMCALMSYVATQPFRYTKDGKEKPCVCLPCWHVILEACGRREKEVLQTEEELNSHVWSSAFEPCLPKKPTMYSGLAAKEASAYSQNTNVNNASVNINLEQRGGTDKDLQLDKSMNLNGMKKAKSTEAIGSELNNRTKSPPISGAPFFETNNSQVVRNELQAPIQRGDKVTNCRSMPIQPSADGEWAGLEKTPSHHSVSDVIHTDKPVDVSVCSSPADISVDVTEETPLNPAQ
ncbi:proline-rich transmembrane protein 4-like [Lytechinus pictus]|uniref:proline-rich transmembrane protein 4-like n=1 Tax=Lytechinus pictus TaxID=7653 RepID=UPI0030B9B9CE